MLQVYVEEGISTFVAKNFSWDAIRISPQKTVNRCDTVVVSLVSLPLYGQVEIELLNISRVSPFFFS